MHPVKPSMLSSDTTAISPMDGIPIYGCYFVPGHTWIGYLP